MAKAFVVIDTQDMDDLGVEVFDSFTGAIEYVLETLGDGPGSLTDFQTEDGAPAEAAISAWMGEDDLDVWHEERVILTLKVKETRA